MILSLRGNSLANENGEPVEFPGYSSGYTYTKFGVKFMKIDKVNETFLGSWIMKPLIPTISFVAAVFSIPLASYFYFSCFPYWQLMVIIDTTLMIFFLVSFFRTSIDGPGYYPFYWSIGENPIFDNNYDDESTPFRRSFDPPPAGIISNDAQLTWARTRPRPPRSIVAKSARRIVIRPDHYCKYSETWIGKRNFKFFILFNLYGFLFIGFIALCGFFVVRNNFKQGKWSISKILFLIDLIGEIAAIEFAGFCFSFLAASLNSLFRGITDWERTNKLPVEKFSHKTVLENVEDVMGPISKFYLYLSPFYSPWKNIPNNELIAGYNNYYE